MSGSSNYSQQQLSSQTQGGGRADARGGILRILELEGCLNMPACGSARQNQCFPIHGLNIARNKERRHPSIVAYSDADLGTSDANTGRSLTDAAIASGEDARCSQHAMTLCPLSSLCHLAPDEEMQGSNFAAFVI